MNKILNAADVLIDEIKNKKIKNRITLNRRISEEIDRIMPCGYDYPNACIQICNAVRLECGTEIDLMCV